MVFELYKDYELRLYKCGYDQRYAKDFLERMNDYNFECEMIYQNKYVMSSPMKLVEADLHDNLINYNQNEIDKWCYGNIGVLIDDLGYYMPVKQKNKKSMRIDGAVTTIILYEIFRRYRSNFMNQLGG